MENTSNVKKKKSTTMIIFLIVGILAIIGYIGSTADDLKQPAPVGSSPTLDAKDPASVVKEEKQSLWRYSTDSDKMDNTERSLASLTATNTLTFEFPYGESSFTLNVRKWKGETAVYLFCSECQFITGIADEKRYRIKIDNDPPFTVTANQPSDGSSNTVFLGSAEKIISKLKTASNLIIEAEFFQEGYQQIVFFAKGLQWK